MGTIMKAISDVRSDLSDVRSGLSEVQSDVAKIRAVTADPPSPQTPSLYGANLLKDAARDPSIISSFNPSGEEALFENVFKFSGDSGERKLIDTVYKRMQEVFGDLRLVSSEDQPWLNPNTSDSRHNQKPDLICLHKAYVLYKGARNHVPLGVPANLCFYENVSIIDFKVSPTDAAFGEFAIHMIYLYNHIKNYKKCKDPIEIRGAVAHNEGLWLARFRDGTLREIIKMNWNDAGSVRKIQMFFEQSDETGFVLDAVCKGLGCKISDRPKKGCQAFLGAGGTGKVFRVEDGKVTRAAKIVVGDAKVKLLRQEKEILNGLGGMGVAVKFHGFYEVKKDDVVVGAGLTMEPVGSPISKLKNLAKVFPDALRVLSKIHATGLCHGDPRTHNILMHKRSVIFCDFQQYAGFVKEAGSKARVMQDMDIIFESFGIKITEKLSSFIEKYAELPNVEAIENIIRELSCPPT
jgi:tRNA A-37 threonylcarbamoyl transferase component Bud32